MKYLYPFFMGLYPLINLYNDNKGEVLFFKFNYTFYIYNNLNNPVMVLFYCIFKNKEKSCIFTGISVLLFGLFNLSFTFFHPNETSGISEWILLSLLIFVYICTYFSNYINQNLILTKFTIFYLYLS